MGQLSITKNIDILQPTLSPDNFFVLSADTNNEDKFRYVFNMFIDNNLVYAGKCSPNPEGLGIVTVGNVIDDYAVNTPIAFSGSNQIFVHQTEYFSKPPTNEVIEYSMFFGEEHANSSGIITGYTGVGKAIGEPAYPSGAKRSYLGTMGRNFYSNLQEYDTNSLMMVGYDNKFPSTESLFLTNSPRIREVGENDYFTLSALNYKFPNQLYPNASFAYDTQYKFYDSDNTLITGYTTNNIRENGGGPRTGCSETFNSYNLPTGETQNMWNIIHIGAGPRNIYVPDGSVYYTVQLLGLNEAPPPSPSAGVSPTPTPTPTTTPAPSPSPLPAGYTKWLFQPCCDGGSQIVLGIESGTTGTVRVYNNKCYYALNQTTDPELALVPGAPIYSSCIPCKAVYECRAAVSGSEPTPTPTPDEALRGTPPVPDLSCPDYQPVSELFTFNIQCQYDAFNSRQFIFKNRFGTWDYFRFNYKKVEQIDIDRERYKKFSIDYGSSNPQKTTYRRGITDYSTQIREIHTVNTGFINQSDMYYLEELYTSNDVYLILDNNDLFPVNIISTSFDKKTAGRGKEITNLTLQYEFSNNIKLLNK
tara:strand:+ start:1647 stop:3407 length:1761 start_codon:yes stop_codon:yes gene_type:complete